LTTVKLDLWPKLIFQNGGGFFFGCMSKCDSDVTMKDDAIYILYIQNNDTMNFTITYVSI